MAPASVSCVGRRHALPTEWGTLEAMFQLLKEDEFSYTSFLFQQALVPIVGFLAVAFTSDVPRAFTFGIPNPTLENFWGTLIALLLPFCAALIARRAAPRLSKDGRLIWAAPISLVMLCLIGDSVRSGFKSTIANYFNPQIGEAGWVFVLLLIPTYSCVAYSFGVSEGFARLAARLVAYFNKYTANVASQ